MKEDNEFSFLLALWVEISIMTALEIKRHNVSGGDICFDWASFDKAIDINSSNTSLLKESDSQEKSNKRKNNESSTSEVIEKKSKPCAISSSTCAGTKESYRQTEIEAGNANPQSSIEKEEANALIDDGLLKSNLEKEVESSMKLLNDDLYLSDDSDSYLNEYAEGTKNS